MPSPAYVEDPADKFDYEKDWLESAEMSQPGGGGHASPSEQEAVLVGLIPFNKIRSARRFFLGFSYCDTGPPYGLHRELPHVHPTEPNLRAFSFSAQGFVPQSNELNEEGEGYIESPFEDGDGNAIFYMGYQKAVVIVRYRSFGRMKFLPDEDIEDFEEEWTRWTQFRTEPSLELLQVSGVSNIKYAEGPLAGKPFPVPLAQPIPKMKLIITWMNVPFEYISDDADVLNPVKFLACVGKVNSDTFLDKYEPGTVAIYEPPVFEPTLYPVVSTDPDNYPLAGFDIRITVSIFDPPKGEPDSDFHGHNLLPHPDNGLFYLGTRDGTTAGATLLPAVPFMKMFQHVLDPS